MTKKDTKKVADSQPQTMELIQETYVDGVASISIRQNVAKIDFYQASPIMNKGESGEQKEFRKVSHRLALPVTGLNEIYGILGNILKENKEK
jgi:hypothetical protein